MLLALSACTPAVAPARRGTLTRERADECTADCAAIGMKLSSVVLIMNSAGCVCVPAEAPPDAPHAEAAAAGGAAIAVAVEQLQRLVRAQP